MDLRKLKKLIDLVQESGIAELEITEGEERVRIVKGGEVTLSPAAAPVPAAAAPAAAVPGTVNGLERLTWCLTLVVALAACTPAGESSSGVASSPTRWMLRPYARGAALIPRADSISSRR